MVDARTIDARAPARPAVGPVPAMAHRHRRAARRAPRLRRCGRKPLAPPLLRCVGRGPSEPSAPGVPTGSASAFRQPFVYRAPLDSGATGCGAGRWAWSRGCEDGAVGWSPPALRHPASASGPAAGPLSVGAGDRSVGCAPGGATEAEEGAGDRPRRADHSARRAAPADERRGRAPVAEHRDGGSERSTGRRAGGAGAGRGATLHPARPRRRPGDRRVPSRSAGHDDRRFGTGSRERAASSGVKGRAAGRAGATWLFGTGGAGRGARAGDLQRPSAPPYRVPPARPSRQRGPDGRPRPRGASRQPAPRMPERTVDAPACAVEEGFGGRGRTAAGRTSSRSGKPPSTERAEARNDPDVPPLGETGNSLGTAA